MLYKLAVMFPQDVLLQIFGIGLFVGIPTIVALLVTGFRAITFGLMYGMSEGIFKKLEDRADNVVVNVLYFVLRAVLSPIGLLAYAFSRDLRVKSQRNYATYRIQIKKDARWEKHFIHSLDNSLRLYEDIYGPGSTAVLVETFFDESSAEKPDLLGAGEAEASEIALEENAATPSDTPGESILPIGGSEEPLKIKLVSSRKRAEKRVAAPVTPHMTSRKKVVLNKKR